MKMVETAVNNPGSSNFMKVNYRELVSHADLVYERPVSLSQAGMPIGNGRMGSMIWTSPTSLKMQINRVDVFAVNCETNSFPRRHTDYANGCAYVDINMVNYGEDVFAGESFRQHLSVYDGLVTTKGKGITTRAFAWAERDVIAIEIEDKREHPVSISVDLRMLRYQRQLFYGENFKLARKHAIKIQTKEHFATSSLNICDGRIILKQEFREGDYYNAEAVAISVIGRDSKARYFNESTVRLSVAEGKGHFTVLIGSAASFDPEEDVEAQALKELFAAETKGFEGLLASHKAWWNDYLSKAFVHLHSEDGKADYVEQHYTYFLYLMGSSSRGDYPPRFINSIWCTTGDQMHWGSQYWWWNQSAWHNPLLPTNRFELMDPLFNMYSKHLESYARAARQQWGSKGIYFPETTFFDGFEELPEDIAAEMRELYLVRKPWEKRSERFIEYATPKLKHNSRWNWSGVGHYEQGHWVIVDKGAGPFGHVTHSTSPTGKIAFLYWLRYEYTQDTLWLRDYAYPVIKGAVEFYRNFPNLRKDDNGKYNIYHVSYDEEAWDIQNSIEEMAAMYGMIPILIRASEILKTDADMRPIWQEFYENLAPFPNTELLPESNDPVYWISGIPPARLGSVKSPNLEPAIFFDLLTIGTKDKEMIRMGDNTYNKIFPNGTSEKTRPGQSSRTPVAAAHLGRASDIKNMLPGQLMHPPVDEYFTDSFGPGIMPNRITLQAQAATDFERLGNNAHALHAALLQSVPPAPGKDPVIYLFPAWPREWDAAYTLAARGGFLVTASIEKGEIGLVEIKSRVGGKCRLSNPWPGKTLSLYRNGKKAEDLSGTLITFSTKPGEIVTIVPSGFSPPKIVIP